MSKQIRPNELAEIVTGLLVRPDLLNAFDGSSQVHEEFIDAIGRVVTDYCGGRVNCVHPADLPMDSKPCFVETAYLSIWPDENLPSLEKCVWSPYDPEGWADHVPGEFNLPDCEPRSDAETAALREQLRRLMNEAVAAQSERYTADGAIIVGMDPTAKHTLTTFTEGARYIDALMAAGLCYHFDDSAADCLSDHDLSASQIEAIEYNVAQFHKIDWKAGGYDCPFHYALDKSNEAGEARELKATDAYGETLEIDNPVELLVETNDIPAGAQLIVRDIALAGANQDHVELICEDTHDGTPLTVDPADVFIKNA